jgi:CRISPR-associated endonuclease/helicase Cas3
MTSLREHPGRPDVAPWIRGWVEEKPQTEVLWRRYLPIRADDSRTTAMRALSAFLEEAPPHLSEILETYTYSVADLMRARTKAILKGHEGDAIEASNDTSGDGAESSVPSACALWPVEAARPCRRARRIPYFRGFLSRGLIEAQFATCVA